MELRVDLAQWQQKSNKQACRPQTIQKQDEVFKQTAEFRRLKVCQDSDAEFYSQVHLTPKPHQPPPPAPTQWRFCIDYRALNRCTESTGSPLPNIRDIIYRLGKRKAKYFCKLDLTSGYHQAPLHPASRKFTAFRTFGGLLEWLRVPMGLKGAPGYFQNVLQTDVLRELLYKVCELYIDDIIIFADTPDNMVTNLDKVLTRLLERGIVVSPKKCEFGVTEIDFLGHTVNSQGCHFSREKLDKATRS